MKNKTPRRHCLNLALFSLIVLSACNKYDEPGLIYEPDKSYTENPVISAVQPPDSAVAGIREIAILGQHFAATIDSNGVYFQGQKAIIKSASPTALIVYRPANYGDSIHVSVSVSGALGVASLSNGYALGRPLYPYDNRDVRVASLTYTLTALEVDNNENLYFASQQVVYKVTPSQDISRYAASLPATFLSISDIRFGPGGYMYVLVNQAKIYRLAPGGALETSPSFFASLPKGTASVLDFDQNGNMYTGYRNGIYVVHPDKTIRTSGRYSTSFKILKIRVYNGYVYAAASYTGSDASISKMALWRNQIIGSDSLAPNELVVDLNANPNPAVSKSSITSFDLDINGRVYLCLQSADANSPLPYFLYVVENGGLVPFYTDAILPPVVDQIVWGSKRDMYLNRGITISNVSDSVRVYRMGMGVAGAPYLGR